MDKDYSLPFWEINSREALLSEVTLSPEETEKIETEDKITLGYIHLMQNVKGKRYRPKLDEG